MSATIKSLALWACAGVALAAPTSEQERSIFSSPYAPVPAACPAATATHSSSLLRQASGLSSAETSWLAGRKPVADQGLAAWLTKVDSSFDTSCLPAVGLTTSGGGYRSFLAGAGVVQGLDGRDSSLGTSGLYQGLTYHGGLSGGSWLVSSIAGNQWQTVSALTSGLWSQALNEGLLTAEFSITNPTYAEIIRDILDKKDAGYEIVLDDVWGRLLSNTLLEGEDGDPGATLSGVASFAPFTEYSVPFPIVTSIGVDTAAGECIPPLNATQYEFSPFEFGSWGPGVNAFTPTKYLGTNVTAGKPTNSGATACTTGFDNLGYILGTSSNLFNEVCGASSSAAAAGLPPAIAGIAAVLGKDLSSNAEYATYPNPFYKSPISQTSPDIAAATDLTLVDGGETDQNDPIWPFIQPAQRLDVLIVNDNSADTTGNFPNGSEIHQTYVRAQAAGLSKMPSIPDPSFFTSSAVSNGRPTFFGCNSPSELTIVYLPNYNYTYPSGEPTLKLQYSPSETAGMISNGNAIASKNGDKQWPTCLACAIMHKTDTKQPEACAACLAEYCYN